MAEEKNISLLTNVEEGTIVEADEALLLSAITNLISNGIKYGKDSGYVAITTTQTDATTEISVKDNGMGIAEPQIDKIWGRFYRVDDVRNDEYGSSGLGLAMVKSIVELHGGTITVSSTPDKVTTFKITLKNYIQKSRENHGIFKCKKMTPEGVILRILLKCYILFQADSSCCNLFCDYTCEQVRTVL